MPSSFLRHPHREQYQSQVIADVPSAAGSYSKPTTDSGLGPYNSEHLTSFMSRRPPRHIDGLERHPDAPAPFSLDFFSPPADPYEGYYEPQSVSNSRYLETESALNLNEEQEEEERYDDDYASSDYYQEEVDRPLSIAEELEKAWNSSSLEQTTHILEPSQSFITAIHPQKSEMATSSWSIFSATSILESDEEEGTPQLQERNFSAFSSDSSSGSDYSDVSEPSESELILYTEKPTGLSHPLVDDGEVHDYTHDTGLPLNSNTAPLITIGPLVKKPAGEPLNHTTSGFSILASSSSIINATFSRLVRRLLGNSDVRGPEKV